MNERQLFLSALEIEDPEARRAHLQAESGGDDDLLARVEALLASHEGQSQFLKTPVVEQMSDDPRTEIGATILQGDGSTRDEEAGSFTSDSGSPTIHEDLDQRDDEDALGFLEPSTRPDSLGRLAHYEILEVIGTGAFGTVLKAFDEKLQRVVAIKVMALELAAMSPARKRFLREARSSAQVRHENVVSIHNVEDKPIPYLVMEYIPGQTLQQRLDEHGPLDLLDVLRLGKQIAAGLAAAHARDLIHRDIKPGNILLDTSVDCQVKITDFGLARTVDDATMTQSGMIAGTPLYMAPEQALGHKLDQRADLFSLGSVLYQMLSGRPPFRAPSTIAVLKRVAEDTPRPIQEIIPEVPDWMCELIGHLHAKNPDERYSSAKEVCDLLAQFAFDLQEGRLPEIPNPTEGAPDAAEETAVTVSKAVQPPRSRSPLHNPLLRVASVVLILLGVLVVTEANGVTKITTSVIRIVTAWGTVEIKPHGPNPQVEFGPDGALTIRPGPGSETPPPSAKEQVDGVRKELKRLNPGFDEGTLEYKIKDGVVVELRFLSDHVTDITPVGKLTGLKSLDCSGSWTDFHFNSSGQSRLADLSPLQGLKLVSLDCNGTEVFDLSPLREMPLEHLSLAVTPVSDLSAIEPQRLTYFNLGRTHVTDTELAHFEGCKNLTSLILPYNRVTDAGLAWFKDCEDLSTLNLRETQITDEGLADFERCHWINLDLAHTQLTDAGLAHLQNCEELTIVSLGETSVSDAGMKQFQNCKNLKALDLNGTLLTDAGIEYFQNCEELTFLWIKGTQVTDAGLAHFKNRKLANAWISQTKVTDLSLLREMPLEWLVCDLRTNEDADILRSIETLRTINFKPAAEFWKNVKLARRFASGKFFNVISLIDPEHDKWPLPPWTGTNEWRKENGELIAVREVGKAHKLVFPLDSDWAAFECELDLTRRAGGDGFAINIPTKRRDCPLTFGLPDKAGVVVGELKQAETVAEEGGDIENGTRIKFRILVRRGERDEIELWRNVKQIGRWTGDCERLALDNNEGYPQPRRFSLFTGSGSEFVFHTIRVKMLDGGTATTLRPAP